MRTTRIAMTTVLAAGLLGVGAPALAAGVDDENCDDFASQEEAQAHYDADRSGPDQLDRDDDGEACENHDYPVAGSGDQEDGSSGDAGTEQGGSEETGDGDDGSDDDQMTMPSGGADTGAGGAAGDVTGLLATGGLLAAAGAGGLVLLRRRSQV